MQKPQENISKTEFSFTLRGPYTMIKWDLFLNQKWLNICKWTDLIQDGMASKKIPSLPHLIGTQDLEQLFIEKLVMIKTVYQKRTSKN